MEQQVSLTGPDGYVFSVFSVEPNTASRGTIVVVQEIFGVNAHIRDVARGFSEAGYRAVAPAPAGTTSGGASTWQPPAAWGNAVVQHIFSQRLLLRS